REPEEGAGVVLGPPEGERPRALSHPLERARPDRLRPACPCRRLGEWLALRAVPGLPKLLWLLGGGERGEVEPPHRGPAPSAVDLGGRGGGARASEGSGTAHDRTPVTL